MTSSASAGRRGTRAAGRRAGALLLGAALLAAVLPTTPAAAQAAAAGPDTTPTTVTADALPTAQVDGVVWSQAVVRDTVYVGGSFATARPAGAAPGTSTTPRTHLMAYDLRTGVLSSSFAPRLNGQVLALAASPDGSRLYAAGDFTTVDGVNRYRIAAFDTATGALVTGFAPVLDARARALAVSGDAVYVGGSFSTANGNARRRLAAFRATDGGLLPWTADADATVYALVAVPDGSKVVAGGSFTTLGGQPAYGTGALHPATGAVLPWKVNEVVRNAGVDAAVNSLSTDGTNVYGTGFVFGAGTNSEGNFEGAFAADPADGALRWLQDCHGDTYAASSVGEVVYTVSHANDCARIGGPPRTEPKTSTFALAFTKAARGTLLQNTVGGHADFGGRPAPGVVSWLPRLQPGTYTGQNQAGWTLTSTPDYLLAGGEFTAVNGVPQQGLVRFAVRPLAPNKQGPVLSGAPITPHVVSRTAGTARLAWQADWDRDDAVLTYAVLRDGAVVSTQTAASTSWARPTLGVVDTGLVPGRTYRYRLRVSDPSGNAVLSDTVSVVASSVQAPRSAYADAVRADRPSVWWRLGDAPGTRALDEVAFDDLAVRGGTAPGAGGAVGDTDTATAFDGSVDGPAATTVAAPSPSEFSVEAWVRAAPGSGGGRLIGYSDKTTGYSSSYDRQLYLDADGFPRWGVYDGGPRVLVGPQRLDDGAWHHVVGSLSSAGTALHVDGRLVAQDTGTTRAGVFSGYWRVGGDTLAGWPGRPVTDAFTGELDELAVYPRALTTEQVARHHAASVPPVNAAPAATFTATTDGLTVTTDASASSDADGTVAAWSWDFGDGGTATGRTASRTYAAAGSYAVRLVVTDDAGATSSATRTVTVTAPPAPSPTQTPTPTETPTSSPPPALTPTSSPTPTLTPTSSPTSSPTPTVDPGLARDAFGRSTSGGWGSADLGGAWTPVGDPSLLAVDGAAGTIRLPAAGWQGGAALDGVRSASTDTTLALSVDKPATGGGTYLSVLGRRTAAGDYRGKLRLTSTGAVTASLSRTVRGTETALTSTTLPGVTYAAGDVLRVRLQVTGTGPTALRLKVWRAGAAEPASWTLSASDLTADLQAAGGVGVLAYVSGSATNAPVTATVDALAAVPVP